MAAQARLTSSTVRVSSVAPRPRPPQAGGDLHAQEPGQGQGGDGVRGEHLALVRGAGAGGDRGEDQGPHLVAEGHLGGGQGRRGAQREVS